MVADKKPGRSLAIKRILCLSAGIVSIGCLLPPAVYGASNGTQPQIPGTFGVGLFLAWGIAYLTRRRAIGGWLLYFYLQLYMSFLLSLVFIPRVISSLAPGGWDNAMRYVFFILSTIPVLLAEGLEVFAATRLLVYRNKKNLHFLLKALIILVFTSAIALAIDIAYFQEDLAIGSDALTLIFSAIWTTYFFKSERVRFVFIDKAWFYTMLSPSRTRTLEEKRYLWKRAALVAAVTFVILLIMMGATMGDKKADVGIFTVPVFYALIAAVIGWYAPIRKKKLETLLNPQMTKDESKQAGGSI